MARNVRVDRRVVGVVAAAALALLALLAYRHYWRRRRRENAFPLVLLAAAAGVGSYASDFGGGGGPRKGHSSFADHRTGNVVRVYQNSNFTGDSTAMFDPPGRVHHMWKHAWNDKASSIRVPLGRSARLWNDGQGKGSFIDLPPGNWDLWQLNWNDKVSSMMTWKTDRAPPPPINVTSHAPTGLCPYGFYLRDGKCHPMCGEGAAWTDKGCKCIDPRKTCRGPNCKCT